MRHLATGTWLISGLWLAALAVIIGSSVSMGARLSTSALLLVLGLAPVVIMLVIAGGSDSPTVAEIIHAADVGKRD